MSLRFAMAVIVTILGGLSLPLRALAQCGVAQVPGCIDAPCSASTCGTGAPSMSMEDVVRLARQYVPCDATHDVHFVGRPNGCVVDHPGAPELAFFAAIATEESNRIPCIVQCAPTLPQTGYGLWQITGLGRTPSCDLTDSCCNAFYMACKREAGGNNPYVAWEGSAPDCARFEAAWPAAVQAVNAVCGVDANQCHSDIANLCQQAHCGCQSDACVACPSPPWLPAVLSVLE